MPHPKPQRAPRARVGVRVLARVASGIGAIGAVLQRAVGSRSDSEEVTAAFDTLKGELLWRMRDAHESHLSPASPLTFVRSV